MEISQIPFCWNQIEVEWSRIYKLKFLLKWSFFFFYDGRILGIHLQVFAKKRQKLPPIMFSYMSPYFLMSYNSKIICFNFFFLTEEKYSSSWTSKCVSWQYCSCQWTKSASWFHRYIAISDKANQAIWSTAQYHINLHLQIGFLPQSRVVRKWSVLMAKSTNMLM